MSAARRAGRIVGALLIAQLAGLIVPFVLLLPLATGTPRYLAEAAGASSQIVVAVFLLLGNGALTVGISLAVLRTLRERSEPLALSLIVASTVMLALQAVDNAHVLSMVSLGRYAAGDAGTSGQLLALAEAVASTRRWTHLTELLAIDAWILLLYAALVRFVLVPRVVAVFGLATVTLHLVGIPLGGFLGYGPFAVLGMPLALSHLVLATWLMARGFAERALPATGRAPAARV